MMCNEWAKFPAASASIGAYRHGFIESADADVGYVIFAPSGKTQASALALARELESYGASVLLVANGNSGTPTLSPEASGLSLNVSARSDESEFSRSVTPVWLTSFSAGLSCFHTSAAYAFSVPAGLALPNV